MAPRPPPPTVEDESDALLKEHGSVADSTLEEPPSRGDVDQATLMEEVHEHNPERRFVVVPTADVPSETSRRERKSPVKEAPKVPPKESSRVPSREPTKVPSKQPSFDTPPPVPPKGKASKEYEANTARRYDTTNLAAEPAAAEKRPSAERRRSRQDLPQIETDLNIEPTKGHHRTRSSTYADQPRPDYFAGQSKRMATNEDLLSPQVIKHTTGGRDKIYYDYSRPQPARPLAPQRSRTNLASDRRADDSTGRPTQSLSPGATRRAAAETEVPRSSKPAYGDVPSESSRYRTDPERRRERRNSYRRESPPPRDGRADSSSSGEGASLKPAPPLSSSRRRQSAVIHDDRPSLQAPDREKAAASSRRSRSRAPTSPLPSPSISNGGSFRNGGPPSPRASATFPLPRDSRESLPYPDDEPPKYESLPMRDDRYAPRSRASQMQSPAMSMPAIMPIMPVMPSEGNGPYNRPIVATPIQDPRMSASQPNLDSPWPPVFDPAKDGLKVDNSNSVSFRRYSEDVGRGGLPEIPDCPRRKGAAGKADWLALPRCDNFNICPTCYTGVFAESPFRNEFVPMPFRPADKLIVCDFGTSPWYRIAWLLTIKNGQPDLRLFHQIAQINNLANTQPCPKDRESVRVWYSIRDPRKQSTLADYTVCYECCKTIEILLPNLTGAFVPLQTSAVPSLSRCSMHFHATRKRFVLYFDALETASDEALATKSAPDIAHLARVIGRLSIFTECHQDRPVRDQNWHVMQYVPEFTVCGECFEDVVKPELEEGTVARDFYAKPQRLQVATCQLYSKRMRDVFIKACRRSDPKYLESRVLERLKVERDIQTRLQVLQRYAQDERAEREMDKLIDEWRKWE
jgi:hypothetical protein